MTDTIRDISDITFITNRFGETLLNTNKPLSKKELAWYLKMNTQECALFVETKDGRRGLLYLAEFSVADANDFDERQFCAENGIDNSETVLRKLVSITERIKKAGFNPFIGENTGPFDRHELGGFIEAFTPPNNQTQTWLDTIHNISRRKRR